MKPLRGGRCAACSEYLRRRGNERPYVVDGRVEKAGQRCHLKLDAADNAARRRERQAAASGQLPFPTMATMPEHRRGAR